MTDMTNENIFDLFYGKKEEVSNLPDPVTGDNRSNVFHGFYEAAGAGKQPVVRIDGRDARIDAGGGSSLPGDIHPDGKLILRKETGEVTILLNGGDGRGQMIGLKLDKLTVTNVLVVENGTTVTLPEDLELFNLTIKEVLKVSSKGKAQIGDLADADASHEYLAVGGKTTTQHLQVKHDLTVAGKATLPNLDLGAAAQLGLKKLTVDETATVKGTATIGDPADTAASHGVLAVGGKTTAQHLQVNHDLTVAGKATLPNLDKIEEVEFGKLTVDETATIKGATTVGDLAYEGADKNFLVVGGKTTTQHLQVNHDLTVAGKATLANLDLGAIAELELKKLTVHETATIKGVTTIGDLTLEGADKNFLVVGGKISTNYLKVSKDLVVDGRATLPHLDLGPTTELSLKKLTVDETATVKGTATIGDPADEDASHEVLAVGGTATTQHLQVKNDLTVAGKTILAELDLGESAQLKLKKLTVDETATIKGAAAIGDPADADPSHEVLAVSGTTTTRHLQVKNDLTVAGKAILADLELGESAELELKKLTVDETATVKGTAAIGDPADTDTSHEVLAVGGKTTTQHLQVNHDLTVAGKTSLADLDLGATAQLELKKLTVRETATIKGAAAIGDPADADASHEVLAVGGKTTTQHLQVNHDLTVAGKAILPHLDLGPTTELSLKKLTVDETATVKGTATIGDPADADASHEVLAVGGKTSTQHLQVNHDLTVAGKATLPHLDLGPTTELGLKKLTVDETATVKGTAAIGDPADADASHEVLAVGGKTTTQHLQVNNDLTVAGKTSLAQLELKKLTVDEMATVKGAATIGDPADTDASHEVLAVGGKTTINHLQVNHDLTVAGKASLAELDLGESGQLELKKLTVDETATVKGTATIGDPADEDASHEVLAVGGKTSTQHLRVNHDLTVAGKATVAQLDLGESGQLELKKLTVNETATVKGAATIGDPADEDASHEVLAVGGTTTTNHLHVKNDLTVAGKAILADLELGESAELEFKKLTVDETATIKGAAAIGDPADADPSHEVLAVGGKTTINHLQVNNDLTVAGKVTLPNLDLGESAELGLKKLTVRETATVKGAATIGDLADTEASHEILAVGGKTTTTHLRVNQDLTIGGTTTAESAQINQNLTVNGLTQTADIVVTDASGKETIKLDRTGRIRFPQAADCAEEFDSAEPSDLEPGTVVILDQNAKLRQSCAAYDKRVAGVISGAGGLRPGIVLDHQAEVQEGGRLPIALLGKVYCKVDATYGAVEVGDLLTTSPTPGHAMKVSDPLKAFGAVIGKALSPMETGEGIIPVLVALQ
jgi:hypothetical protein